MGKPIQKKPDIKIFVSHRIDQDSETIDNPLYVNVRCGAVYDKRENITMLGDNTGDNISEKKDSFCELTVLYWAWKNIETDYYGLCHYRRFLSFSEKNFSAAVNDRSRTGLVYSPDFDTSTQKFKLNNIKLMQNKIADTDALVLERYDVKSVGHNSVYEMWKRDITNFDVNVIDTVLKIIKTDYADAFKYAQDYFNQSKTTFYNLFIMNKELFNEYCEFLFGVLFKLETEIDTSHYNSEKKRIIGYVGEHLLGIFLLKIDKDNKKILYTQGVFIDEVVKRSPLTPAFQIKNNVIVFSSSDFFCPYLAVALGSLVEHSTEQENYDIIILEKSISELNKKKLKSIFKKANFSLRFINVKTIVYNAKFYLPEDNEELSEETYYTILVPWLLENYKKALVLDCDILIKDDLSKLYTLNLQDNYIAAAKEILFHGFLNNPYINVDKSITKYCKENLGLKDEYSYFNAGVLLINLEAFRAKFTLKSLLQQISQNNFRIVEQDLLNKICEGKIVNLDYRWNFMACISDETKPQLSLVSENEKKLYDLASESPSILHYITQCKPWKYPELQYADEWWTIARRSAFYEICLYRMMENCTVRRIKNIEPAIYDLQVFAGFHKLIDPRSGVRKLADKLLPKGTLRREFAKRILPKGSKRWRFCKQIYYIFRPQYRPIKVK
ncbi:DUF4422 domain-containing protein [Oscillospiraceae bacterium MB08-C2-2]|nr:DUF4422 domain-containing protein [Oscillospiraceae bacterium MB08-C2-2]